MADPIYAIVIFDEVNEKGEKLMDIIPMSWLTETKDGEFICKYFPNGSFEKRDHFLKNLTPAEKNWSKYPVELLSTADSLERAKKHLSRAKTTAEVDTTDAECNAKHEKKTSTKSGRPANKYLKPILSMRKFAAAQNSPVHEMSDSEDNDSESPKSSKKQVVSMRIYRKVSTDPDNSSDDAINNIQVGLKKNSLAAKTAKNVLKADCQADNLPEERKNNTSQLQNSTNSVGQNHLSMSVVQDERRHDFLQQIREIIHAEVESAKLSILHDLQAKVGQMQNTILQTNIPTIPHGSPNELMKKLDTKFPTQSLNDFLDFDKKLEDGSQADALCSLYQVLLFKIDKPSSRVKTLMGHTLSKEVSLHYSGSGRDINGKHKLSWKETKAAQIMKEAIMTRFNDQTEKDIQKLMATWLAGAGDRDGGRRERDEKRKG